jgi:hypothetical protein
MLGFLYTLGSIKLDIAFKMDQFNQFDNLDPFFSLPPASPPLVSPPTDASNALALPPLATYPSKEALFEAIQSWSKPRGYAFTIGRSTRRKDGRQKVNYMCDRCPPIRQQTQVSVGLNHAVQGVSFQLLPLRHLPLSGRLDIALRLGLIHIITLLAKAQLPTLHIAGFQLQLKIQPRISFQQVITSSITKGYN